MTENGVADTPLECSFRLFGICFKNVEDEKLGLISNEILI